MPIVSWLPCPDMQDTPLTACLVHITVGGVPLEVVFGVSGPADDGSILKVIAPFTGVLQVSMTVVGVTFTIAFIEPREAPTQLMFTVIGPMLEDPTTKF